VGDTLAWSELDEGVGWDGGPRMAGAYVKGVLTGKLFAVSRKQPWEGPSPLPGWTGPRMAKHRRVQSRTSVTHTGRWTLHCSLLWFP
jgi:hypothetical protein